MEVKTRARVDLYLLLKMILAPSNDVLEHYLNILRASWIWDTWQEALLRSAEIEPSLRYPKMPHALFPRLDRQHL